MWGLALVWGASYLFIKLALEDMEPVFVVWARLVLAGAVLIPLAARANAFGGLRVALGPLILLALIQVVGPFLLITFGERHITSSMTGILVASAPIFTALLGALGPAEDRVNAWSMTGITIGILGVALLFGVDLSGTTETLLAGLAILLAGLGYAVGATITKRRLPDVPPIGLAASIIGLGAILLLPLAPFTLPSSMPSAGTWGALLVLGAGGTGIAFLIFFTLNATVGPSRASIVAYVAPVFSVVYGVALLDERVTLATAGGLVLILLGSSTAANGRAPWRRRERAPADALGGAAA